MAHRPAHGLARLPGHLLARAAAGSWRSDPPSWDLNADELARAAPLLLRTGAGALTWRRVRETALRDTPSGVQLRAAYRLELLTAATRKEELAEAFQFFRQRGAEPLLVKGWAAARLYPEPALRPYGDLDLCVAERDYPAAQAALAEVGDYPWPLELHRGYPRLHDRTTDALFARSELVPLGETAVRIPCPEDHLRLLCLHYLGHGACTPLWLCDIAAAVEQRPEGFDWNYCLSGDPRASDWVACCIGLAHQLLGARVEETPVAARAARLPSWLLPATLRQWAVGLHPSHRPGLKAAGTKRWQRPAWLVTQFRLGWRNPVQASVELHAPFNALPRLPLQLLATLRRAAECARDAGSGAGRS